MTSANVTNYRIEKNGKEVGNHRQHHMCHTHWHRLYKFMPHSQYTITAWWLDEEEEYHESEPQNLMNFLRERQPNHGDMKRMVAYIEKQNAILKEWTEKFGDQDKVLRLTTLNCISYSPL